MLHNSCIEHSEPLGMAYTYKHQIYSMSFTVTTVLSLIMTDILCEFADSRLIGSGLNGYYTLVMDIAMSSYWTESMHSYILL